MNIKQEFLTSKSRPRQALNPIGIILHDTDDAGATAQNEHDYFQNSAPQASAHAIVDWNGIIQLIPWNEIAWHAGHTANHSRLGVELCVPPKHDAEKFLVVWNEAVDLFASLLKNVIKQNTVTTDNIMSHAEASNKWKETDHQDPVNFFKEYGRTVDEFRQAVQAKMKGSSSVSQTTSSKPALTQILKRGSQGQAVKQLQTILNKLKYTCGTADGVFGDKTETAVKAFQTHYKLSVDGEVGPNTLSKLQSLV